MGKIMARFVHGSTELVREIDVDDPADPPLSLTLMMPSEFHDRDDAWEAVYVREPSPEGTSKWIYHYDGVVDADT